MPTIIITLTAVLIAADTMIANGLASVIAAQPLALAITARVTRAGVTATAVTTTTTFLRIGGVHDGQVSRE